MKIKNKDGITIDTETMTGELTLSSAHSMIMGHLPEAVTAEQVSKQLQEESGTELLQFGLFEQATPNYSTYYPDVTAEDLNPKDADFIEPVFRLLSETIVSKGFRPIDFSKPGILKKSMQMLLGQTINIDHEVAVGNAIGAVSAVWWQASYKTKDGITVPAGINGKLKIDGKSNPRIARGIMMNPPSIHSNSVTIRFKWEPSHKFENSSEFYQKLGTHDDKGVLIRMVVSEVLGYSETSLVSHGADSWAQKIKDDGEIQNPQYADRQSFSIGKDESFVRSCLEIDYKTELSFTADNTIPGKSNNNNNNTNPNESDMEELIKEIQEKFGFEEGTLTKENLAAKIVEVHTANLTQIETLKGEKETLTTEKGNLETQVSTLTADLETANANKGTLDSFTEETRNEAVRLYKLAMEDKADENIIGLISKSDLKAAQSFSKQYATAVDEKFKQTCNDCNSTNISRASAKGSEEGLDDGKGGKGKQPKINDFDTVTKNLQAQKRRKSNLFGGSNEG